jgi:hypothetical protein
MSKISIVRSIKQKNNVHLQKDNDINYMRENGWDNRFHLGKLPNYDSHNDNYCIFFYLNFLVLTMKAFKDQIK